ncbi:TPA: hypothetical protein ACOQ31_005571 [Bacillus cereus]|uniref:hypothetical protein n=1 Tax=Bacillus cereus TaxID=1396 RepID=UPI00192756D8|nr:hypothetical protein [Bacillus cereus]MBL3768872.1 hypothetical protein [Bacillus cereus]MBL3774696.1 hypothetical protein [Bacillus cereus]MBL3780480.1 hypothetical protein [Bacillus cereus]MBL3791745.1 hypothetical protein [Bacillus cereus]
MDDERLGCLGIIPCAFMGLLYTLGFYMFAFCAFFGIGFLFISTRPFLNWMYDFLFTTSWWNVLLVYIICCIIAQLELMYHERN